jgi:uncharacterized protein (TIGR03435 family)
MRRSFQFLALLAVLAATTAGAQEFEVASVRSAAPQTGGGAYVGIRGGPGTQDPNRISYVNQSLRTLLGEAYSLKLFQIFGPDWIDTERFDILATLAPNSTRDQSRIMLQHLLADRFQAAIHHEQREFPVFELTVAKSGAKLTHSPESSSPGMNMMTKNGLGRLTATKKTITNLAGALEMEVGTTVVDKTGLTGDFDFTLEFVRDMGRQINAFKGIAQSQPIPVESQTTDGPGLSTALEDQLGLKLDRAKGMLDTIVLDRANKTPTEN